MIDNQPRVASTADRSGCVAPDVLAVVAARPAAEYGPAYVELRGPGGPAVIKLGSVEAAERLISLCERYIEYARWDG